MEKFELEAVKNHGRGFSLWTATVFIIGEVAGGGILSLAHATAQAGWSGLAMIVYCAACAATAGLCLAQSWIILEERYPRYRDGLSRKPFATIAYYAHGHCMSAFVSVLMNVTRLGATAVFLLLTSEFLVSLTRSVVALSLCQWIPIVAAALLMPLWLGSPADFWPIAYTAMVSTTVGSILLVVATVMELLHSGVGHDFHVDGFESFSTAFGAILFAFGGASAFPNFQNDMREKGKFPTAVIFGFIGLIGLYLPTAGLGYAAFGHEVKNNVINNLTPGPIITAIEVCFFVHCLTVVLIIINPVFLDLEELCRIPKNFNWKRCLFRSLLLLLVTFISETFPNFGQILDLVGGSTITLMAFILPPVFYVALCRQQTDPNWPKRQIPMPHYLVFVLIVLSGVIGGIASTYSTLKHWAPLDSACYLGRNSQWKAVGNRTR